MYKRYNLTYSQQNIWLADKFNTNTDVSTISAVLNINGQKFNKNIYTDVINNIIKDNDALRFRIGIDKDEPFQYVKEYVENTFEFVDLSKSSKEDIELYFKRQAKIPIDILSEQLYEFKIIKYDENSGAILYKVHHIIGDAWSVIELSEQVANKIEELIKPEKIEERSIIPSYLDYIENQNIYSQSDKFKKDGEFWSKYLENINNPLSLKSSNKKVTNKSKRYSVELEEKFNIHLNEYCKKNKISPYVLFLTAVATYVYRVTNSEDFLIGTPVLNRSNFKEKRMLGMFVSTIPMRFKIQSNVKFLELAKTISSDTLSMFRHQKYPYSEIIKDVHKNSNVKSKLYNIMLSYQNARAQFPVEGKYSGHWLEQTTIQDELDIHIIDINNKGTLEICYDYLYELFDEIEIKYIHRRLIAIINHAIIDELVDIESINILDDEEKYEIVNQYNDTKVDFNKKDTVIKLFEKQVSTNRDNVALMFNKEKITYGELSERINNFALKLANVKNRTMVIYMENSIDLIVAIYGVLKSGNNYVPITPNTPNARIESIIKDCNCKYIISDGKLAEFGEVISTDYIEKLGNECTDYSDSESLAYLIYTSGSTGVPKGVRIKNKSLTNYISWAKNSYVKADKPIMPLYSPVGFDLTVTTLFLPLISGGTIVIYENNSNEIIKIFDEDKVNIVKLTPAHLSLVNEANIKVKNIKVLILGGEALKVMDAKKITENSNGMNIYNEYGPTEATVGCMIYKYSDIDVGATVPIGIPAANTRLYVLDNLGRICPLGVPGELYIAGDGLADGYNNINKTKEAFIFNDIINENVYKTGDTVLLDFNLICEYFGRNDNQVKINGNRIEIEEIEHVIKDNIDVKSVVIDVRKILGMDNICLYYTSDKKFELGDINNIISKFLPKYMLPSKIMKVDSIPLSVNGKIDRKKLPDPIDTIVTSTVRHKITFRNAIEKIVCQNWRELLNVDSINPDTNIFDYGVDSLIIIKCQVRLSSTIGNIDIQKFYEYPVIKDFCDNINNSDVKNYINKYRLEEYRELNFKIKMVENEKNNVILTGATGYLGANILKELLELPRVEKIYCVVRGKGANNRLKNRFKFYFGNKCNNKYDEKVIVINGDITKENFDIDKESFNTMVQDVHSIINSAAIVKHNGKYSDFRNINVETVKNLISICIKNKLVLEHISTMSVSGHSGKGCFDESKFYINQNYGFNPYIATKFEAELLIYEAIEKYSLNANVYRMGNLTWRYDNGKYQHKIYDNSFYMRLKNMFDLGVYPISFKNIPIEMTPVDYAANFVVSLSMRKTERVNNVYHIYNNNTIKFNDIIDIIKNNGIDIEEIDDNKFMEKLKKYDSDENILLNDIVSGINTLDVLNINIKTNSELKNLNKSWPNLTDEYVKKLLYYLKSNNREESNEKIS